MGDNDHYDDDDSSRGGSVHPDELGKSASQVRKAQNRIAQREFRQRKQQYVRDLEARVEVLSGDREEKTDLMLLLVRNLLKENKELRGMLKSMSSFIGEGLGSCLPRLGLSADQLHAIVTRADTDTAYEAFVNLKASKEMEAANPGLQIAKPKAPPNPPGKRKRDSVDTPGSSSIRDPPETQQIQKHQPQQPQIDQSGPSPENFMTNYAYLFPDLQAFAQHPTPQQTIFQPSNNHIPPQQPYGYPPPDINQSSPSPASFSGFGLTIPATNSTQPPPSPQAVYQRQGVAAGTVSAADVEKQRNLRAAVVRLTETDNQGDGDAEERAQAQKTIIQSVEGNDRKVEAMQLVSYHLNNFRINHSYHLPPSLQPTPVQRTIPHEHVIDGIVFPSIRDRMILLRGRYDLVDCFQEVLLEFDIHGDDVLDHRSWEVSEKWLLKYRMLVDDDVYTITNKWRAVRGDPPLIRPEKHTAFGGVSIAPDGM